MALSWLQDRQDRQDKEINLITDLGNDAFYNSLSNKNCIETLPALKSDSKIVFWRNENYSVSTVLLYNVVHTLGISINPQDLMGTATFYNLLNATMLLDILLQINLFLENVSSSQV